MKTKIALLGALLGVLLSVGSAFADPVGVNYSVVSLGSGEWQYDYTLSGSFLANQDVLATSGLSRGLASRLVAALSFSPCLGRERRLSMAVVNEAQGIALLWL